MFEMIRASGKKTRNTQRDVAAKFDLSNTELHGTFMGGGGSSAPSSPDYTGAANATAAGNLALAQYQTTANRVNQSTPQGSLSYTQDPSTGQWTQSTQLTAPEQNTVNNQQQINSNQSDLAAGLQGQVAQTMSAGLNTPDYGSTVGSEPGVNTNLSQYSATAPNVNTNFNYGGPGVNTNAPQFSDANAQAGAQAAYQGQTALLQPEMDKQRQQQEDQLALQGLTPGTPAYQNAMSTLNNSQATQLNSIAGNSVALGNQEANQNYSSSLAGYNAGNQAQNQNFGQAVLGFNTGNAADQAANQINQTNYSTALSGQEANNQAQNQNYGQALTNYQTLYQQALQNYNLPLQELNAVQSGTSVQNPSFPGYAAMPSVAGPNYSQAAQSLGNWNQGVYSAQVGAQNSQNNALGSIAGTAGGIYAAGG